MSDRSGSSLTGEKSRKMPREMRDSMSCLHPSVTRQGEHTMYFAKKAGSWKNKCNLAELGLAFSRIFRSSVFSRSFSEKL